MKFFLLSDNIDTLTGMRLAGIDGLLLHEREETLTALSEVMDRPDVAVVLMTEKLISLIEPEVNALKLSRPSPVISEIPDRHARVDVTASISRYVKEAVGIEI